MQLLKLLVWSNNNTRLHENGYLMDGNVYMYTAEGRKFRTTVYNGGRVVKEINHEKK